MFGALYHAQDGVTYAPADQACPTPVGFRGCNKETRGTAYVVYDDIYDAKTACDHLSGKDWDTGAAHG